ncbi:MAG: hypothetical protein QM296_11930, partial [Bacillota bacterium]|nr:hypothetical protein [Bacillota bacterium]
MRWCPEIGAGAEKLVHSLASEWQSAPPLSFFSFSQSGGKRIDRKQSCGRHLLQCLGKGGQKLRWCPEIGAGTKKLSKGGQKLRWCPENRAGTKKLSRGGQKLRWCPEIGAGTKKLSKGGQKLRWCPE